MIVCKIWEVIDTTPTHTTLRNQFNGIEIVITNKQFNAVKNGQIEVSTIISNTILHNKKSDGVIAINRRLERRYRKENGENSNNGRGS